MPSTTSLPLLVAGRQHINQTLHNVTESRWIIGRGIRLTITGITKLVAHHLVKLLLLVCSMMVPIYITNENIQLQCINWETKLHEDYLEYNNFRIYGIRSNYNIDTNNSYSFLRFGCLRTNWISPLHFFFTCRNSILLRSQCVNWHTHVWPQFQCSASTEATLCLDLMTLHHTRLRINTLCKTELNLVNWESNFSNDSL